MGSRTLRLGMDEVASICRIYLQ